MKAGRFRKKILFPLLVLMLIAFCMPVPAAAEETPAGTAFELQDNGSGDTDPANALSTEPEAGPETAPGESGGTDMELQDQEPETDPSEPEADPSGPGTDPAEPEADPSEPGTDPTEPEADPLEPGTDPTEPGADPTEPEADPSEPGTYPTEPGADPTEPEADPAEPGTDPTEPETDPAGPKPDPKPGETDPQDPAAASETEETGSVNGPEDGKPEEAGPQSAAEDEKESTGKKTETKTEEKASSDSADGEKDKKETLETKEETGKTSPAKAVALAVSVKQSYTQRSATLTIRNIQDPKASYSFAVWSQTNDQDDLLWFDAAVDGTTAGTRISMSKFRHNGEFIVHAYMNGNTFLGEVRFTVDPATVTSISLSDLDENGKFTFTAEGLRVTSGIKRARIAVWSRADKSDLFWYTLDGETAVCDIRNHKTHFGNYRARLYVTDNSGLVTNVGICTRKILRKEPSASSCSIIMKRSTSLRFTISVQGLTAPYGVKQLKAEVWSEADKSNKAVYTAFTSDGNGNYTCSGTLSKHAYKEGTYQVVLYLKNNLGKTSVLSTFTKKIVPSCKDVNVAYNKTSKKATFSLTGLKTWHLYEKIEYTVWSNADGKDDRKHVRLDQYSGACEMTMDMRPFGINGKYTVHVNGIDRGGGRHLLASKTFTVTNLPVDASCKVTKLSNSKVTVTVYNANVDGLPAESVQIPTWSAAVGVGNSGAQDDIVWYDAEKNDDGTFSCTINRSNHLSSGKYFSHVYAYAKGKSACCASCTFKLLRTGSFTGRVLTVARNSILAVETGGQIYGNARYDDFTEAYHISQAETGITIGAGQWMGANAVRLLMEIQEADPETFASLDTAKIAKDLKLLKTLPIGSWAYYGGSETINQISFGVIKSGSKKAKAIQALISSDAGIAVQNATVERNLTTYEGKIREAGVVDLHAILFMANVCHLGGTGAMNRIVTKTKDAGLLLTVENLWSVMQQDVADTSSENQVGDRLYQSRHLKIISWIYQYLN